MNRREFIATSISGTILAKNDFYLPKSPMGTQISVFSKTLHWIEDPQILAQTIADLGFNGIDLTVRPDGHVLPEKVENDLPKFVASAQKAGISIPMIVSSILQADSLSKKVIETAGKNGISHYRMGWFRYEMGKDIMPQVQQFTENVRQLATINEKFNISGEYQNHGGPNLGASLGILPLYFQISILPFLVYNTTSTTHLLKVVLIGKQLFDSYIRISKVLLSKILSGLLIKENL